MGLPKHKQYLKLRTAWLLEFALPPVLQKYQKEKGEKVNKFHFHPPSTGWWKHWVEFSVSLKQPQILNKWPLKFYC